MRHLMPGDGFEPTISGLHPSVGFILYDV